MHKYINADLLISKELIPLTKRLDYCHPEQMKGVLKAMSKIDSTPAADVVEVVQCKDCIYSREMSKHERAIYLDNCIGCTMHSKSYHDVIMRDDDFCSYGERRKDNDT